MAEAPAVSGRSSDWAGKVVCPRCKEENEPSAESCNRRRFLREAGLAMALIHENTIQIREFGQTDDGHLFFTMDYCEGEPVKAVIAREGFVNVNRALHITRQILSVMKLAHARGIIHRD